MNKTVHIEVRNWNSKLNKLIEGKIADGRMFIQVEMPYFSIFVPQAFTNIINNYQGKVNKIFRCNTKWFAECELFESQPLINYDPNLIVLKYSRTMMNNKVTDILYFYPQDK